MKHDPPLGPIPPPEPSPPPGMRTLGTKGAQRMGGGGGGSIPRVGDNTAAPAPPPMGAGFGAGGGFAIKTQKCAGRSAMARIFKSSLCDIFGRGVREPVFVSRVEDRPGPVSAQVCSVLADLLMSKSMVPMVISQLPYLVELLSADFLPQLYHVNVLRYRPLAPGQ